MKKKKFISMMLFVSMTTSLSAGGFNLQKVKAASGAMSNNAAFTSQDIGNVETAGSATYSSFANEFTVTGAGVNGTGYTTTDIDGLHFVGLSSPVKGDSTIIAKVRSFDIGGATTPTLGLMVRATLEGNSNYAASIIKPTSSSSNATASYTPYYEYRDFNAKKPTTISTAAPSAVNTADDGSFYLKLAYNGSAITKDGDTTTSAIYSAYVGQIDVSGNIQWTLAKAKTKCAVTNTYYIGLAVCSNDKDKAITVNFDNVTIENTFDTSASTAVSALDGMSKPIWSGKGTLTPAVSADGNCTLTWNAAYDNIGITKYNIYEGSNLVGSTADGNTSSFTVTKSNMASIDPAFDPRTKLYTFTVQAVDAAGNVSTDGPSTSSDIIPPMWTSGNLSADTVTQNRVDLSWKGASDSTGVTNYKVYDITNSASPALLATVDGKTTSYSVTNLKSITGYKYKVEAGDSSGNWSANGPSLSVSTTAPAADNTAPTWTSCTLSTSNLAQTGVTLTWSSASDNIGVTGYNIYQGSNKTPIATLSNTQNTYDITGLTSSTSYTFSVQATDEAGNISTDGPSTTIATIAGPTWQSGTLSASNSITAQPNSAGAIYTVVQNDSATLTWSGASDPIGVTGYNILLKGKVIATVDAGTTTYTVAGLSSGQRYDFKVEATDTAGCTSTDGPAVTVTTAAADSKLLPPQNLSVLPMSTDDTSITLVWEKPDNYSAANITDYNIYMDGKKIGDANNNNASVAKSYADSFYKDPSNSSAVKVSNHNYIITGLEPNTSHTFTVRSVDSNGKESTDSNTVTQVTNPAPQIFDVTKYGAVGDGKAIDTAAIQAAIDACTAGGKVLLPAGKTFKSGSISIKSDMTLEVDGKLLGSDNAADYPYPDPTFTKVTKTSPLIGSKSSGVNLQNVRIIGTGTIDANGWKQDTPGADGLPLSLPTGLGYVTTNGIAAAAQYNFALSKGFSSSDAYTTRPNLMNFSGVNVYLGGGLTVENPAQHTLYIGGTNVTVNSIRILSYNNNNGDGIGGSSTTTVLNSVIDTGDDDICFGAGYGTSAEKNPPTQNIWIFDNYYRHGHGAVVAGSGTAAWVQNIIAEDNIMNGTDAGLRCKTGAGTGGGARNIIFRDTAMKNVTNAVQFTSAYPSSTSDPAPDTGRFKHIFISNVSVDTTTGETISIAGCPEAYDEDLHFTNVTFTNALPFGITYLKNSSFNNVKYNGAELTAATLKAANSIGLTFDSYFAGTAQVQMTSVDSPSDITITKGNAVTLPKEVTAHYSDGSSQSVEVVWNGNVDTSKVGTQTIQGTVAGYTGTVSLNVIVKLIDFNVSSTFNISDVDSQKIVNVEASAINNNSSINPALFIIALYDESGTMVNMSYISKNIPVGSTENLSAGFEVPSTEAKYVVKVFVTDGTSVETSSMKPFSNVVTYDVTPVAVPTPTPTPTPVPTVTPTPSVTPAPTVKPEPTAAPTPAEPAATPAENIPASVANSDTAAVLAVITNAIANNTPIPSVEVANSPIVSKEIFNAIKGHNITITFTGNNVSWTFNGIDITSNVSNDIDLSLKAVSSDLKAKEAAKVKAITGKEVPVISFSFNHDGPLPGMATVKVFISKDWANKTVNVCRYYPDKNTYEIIQSNVKVDADGYVSYKTNHCSDYFVVDAALVPDMPKTGSMIDTNILISLSAIAILAGSVIIVSSRKRKKSVK